MKFIRAVIIIACGGILGFASPVRAENVSSPIRVQVTCYAEPGNTYSGSSRTSGIIASKVEWQGCAVNVWKVADDGGMGEFIGTYEILDIGYGAALPDEYGMKSDLSQYKEKSPGTVETGLTLDFRQPTNAECVAFMKETFTGEGSTGSEIFAQLIRGEG